MTLNPGDWAAIGLTLRLAATTMALLLVLCTPLAWWLAHTPSRWRGPVSAVVALPRPKVARKVAKAPARAARQANPLAATGRAAAMAAVAATMYDRTLCAAVRSLPCRIRARSSSR